MFLCCRFLLTRAKISQKKEIKMQRKGKLQIFGISGNPALFTPFLRLFSRNSEVFVRISKKVREIPRIFAFLYIFSREIGKSSGKVREIGKWGGFLELKIVFEREKCSPKAVFTGYSFGTCKENKDRGRDVFLQRADLNSLTRYKYQYLFEINQIHNF